jgi:ketosteroid isomerase-like protein
MKRRHMLAGLTSLFVAFALFTPSHAGRLSAANAADETKSVLEVVRQFQSAGVRGDKAALSQIFDVNVSHFHPGSPYRFVGRDRLVQEFEVASKNQQDMHFEMIDPQVQMAGDTAVVSYYIVESWTDKNGARMSIKEKASEVYLKKADRWLMIHSHYSLE